MRSHTERRSEERVAEVGHWARVYAPADTVEASSSWLEKEDQRPMIICSLSACRLRDIGSRKLLQPELRC
jgi:hypothetical protein